MDLLTILLCIFLPPVAVLIHFGLSGQFLLNILLTLLGGLPGMIHAFWIISKKGA